ncbi:MAG: collagen-like triple helix repeat-containing protein [Bacteroidota bacterium]
MTCSNKWNLACPVCTMILLLGIFYVFTACGNNKIALENSENIEVELKQDSFTYGDTVSMSIFNVSPGGKKTDVSRSHQVELKGEGLCYNNMLQELYILKRPGKFGQKSLDYRVILREDEDSLVYEKQLELDFSAPLTIDLSGADGAHGNDKGSRLRPVLLSNGKNGKDAEDGENGKDASSVKINIWREQEMFYIRAEVLDSNAVFFYQTTNPADLLIDVSGGNGGDGGDGGNGSRGKKGKDDREPGYGGAGGNGGDGGDGAKGGNVIVLIHPNASSIEPRLNIVNAGGAGGKAGAAGEPGDGGKPAPGQSPGADGEPGQAGETGQPGQSGPNPYIEVKAFEIPE